MTLPAPLTPVECDLRDFQFMPVDIARLFGSMFHSHATDAEWRAGMTLWLKSYHQVPAASMPDDDISLARAAEFGNVVKAWRKVREQALRGWVKCSDGRLYHPVVAEKALEGWIEKLRARKSSGAGNAKRHGTPFDPAALDAALDVAAGMLARLNPNSRMLKGRPTGTENQTVNPPTGSPPGSQGTTKGQLTEGIKEDSPPGEPVGFHEFFTVFPKQEQRGPAAKVYGLAMASGITAAELLDGARRFAAHHAREKTSQKYIPLAKTWLSDGCWRDRYLGDDDGNVRPIDVEGARAAWNGHAAALIDALGSNGAAKFMSWFGGSTFEPGPTPKVTFPKEFHRKWVAEHEDLSRPLRALFPDIVLEVAA